MPVLSLREFARRETCSHTLVQKAIKAGHLKTTDGKLDESLVGSDWRKPNRRSGNQSGNVATLATPPEEVATDPISPADQRAIEANLKVLATSPGLLSLADAERLKENYLGRLRQLEYDEKVGKVVLVDEVARLVGAMLASVRTRLLAIPAEQAPRLVRCKTAAEMQTELTDLITSALQELVDGKALPFRRK